jgi:hypothetical protein
MLRAVALLAALGAVAARPGYLAAPLAYNKTTYATELDPSVIVSSDWDAVNVVRASGGAARAERRHAGSLRFPQILVRARRARVVLMLPASLLTTAATTLHRSR